MLLARWLETSFPKFNRHEYYTAVSYINRLGNVRTFKIIWSSKENMVQFFRNQGQRSKNIFHTKIHWIPNFNFWHVHTLRSVFVNSPPPKPEVILTNFFAEPIVLLVAITSRAYLFYFHSFLLTSVSLQSHPKSSIITCRPHHSNYISRSFSIQLMLFGPLGLI